jgi:hypothetical protein
MGKTLLLLGCVLVVLGGVLWLTGRSGNVLPGDIVIERKNVRIYFPIVTCIVLSALLSLIAWWIRR